MVESIRLLIVGTGERSPKIFRTSEPLKEVCSRLYKVFEEIVIEAYGSHWIRLSDKMQADDKTKYEQFKAKTYAEIGLAAFLAIPNVEKLTKALKDVDAGLLESLLRHRALHSDVDDISISRCNIFFVDCHIKSSITA